MNEDVLMEKSRNHVRMRASIHHSSRNTYDSVTSMSKSESDKPKHALFIKTKANEQHTPGKHPQADHIQLKPILQHTLFQAFLPFCHNSLTSFLPFSTFP